MKNTYLFDTGSATPEWKKPSSLDKASALREIKEERNTRYHKCGEFGCSYCDPLNSLDIEEM